MRLSSTGRKITLSDDIQDEIVDNLSDADIAEDIVSKYVDSKHLEHLVGSILSKVEVHLDNAKDEFLK
jgi:hypothetical protein